MDVSTYLRAAKEAECRFCSLLSGAADSFNSSWMAEGAYTAMVSVGAFVPGWTLICPLTYSVNLSDDYVERDFWDFTATAADFVTSRYGASAMFEHGAGVETSLTGCGVGHAHAHLVPLGFSLEDAARAAAPEFNWQACRAADIKAVVNGCEYLFVSSTFQSGETKGSLCILEKPTSQFFRKVIADRLGMGEQYDYKKYPMLEMARISAHELRKHVSIAALVV